MPSDQEALSLRRKAMQLRLANEKCGCGEVRIRASGLTEEK